MILIKHRGDVGWKAPETSKYADENALQDLIARSPNLLPGSDTTPLVIVRELSVPEIGRVDLVGVDTKGSITLVECKLRANPEMRREIVGQVLAYAAGLWGLTYEDFDRAFSVKAGQPLAEQVRAISDSAWDEEAFRAAVAMNLNKGHFRLIIVVDKITDELKRIVLYLNQHTITDTQILALELQYIADGDVEILVPQTYGEESVNPKATVVRKRWTEETLFQKLSVCCKPEGVAAVDHLYRWLIERGGKLYWSDSSLPWASIQFVIGGKLISLISLGEWPEGRGVVAVNFDYLRGIAIETLRSVVVMLQRIPEVHGIYADLEAKAYRQRPNLPIDAVLVQLNALSTIKEVVELLLSTTPIATTDFVAGSDETPAAITGEPEQS